MPLKTTYLTRLLLAIFLLGLLPMTAKATSKAVSTTAIALKNNEYAAVDLLKNGQMLDPDSAADLRKSGFDLSLLDPSISDVWTNTKHSSVDQSASAFPNIGTVFEYKDTVKLNPEGWFRTQIQAVGSDGVQRIYRMVQSLNVHQALMRAALLRKLGYPVQSPKWYPLVKVRFASTAERTAFIGQLSVQAGLVDHKRWVLRTDEKKNEIEMQDVMLESSTITVPTSFYMGTAIATQIKGRRVFRSLIVPFTFLDVPENVDMYSAEAVQLINENLIFTHKYAEAFDECTYDDIRWIIRKIARLSREDFVEIVAAGNYPADIAAYILEKTLALRNNLVAYTRIKDATTVPDFSYNLKLSVGSIREGKLKQERFDGYALRFTHGDPESPLQSDDIVRFVKIEATSSLIHQITSQVNEKLEMFPMDKLLQQRSKDLYQGFFDYLKSNPTKPYVQPISTWGGPIGGASINASRSIVTGSYFGDQSSDFQVSLVDQISAGIRIGYFLGVDGVPNVSPGLGANLSVIRTYVHVRPIPSIQAAAKKDWNELWIPGFMKGLGAMLATSSNEKSETRITEMGANVTKFLEDLKDNESFSVTDTLSLAENASLQIPLTTLLGIDPVSYSATISLGASANQVVLRRTTFTRENGLIKIYLQNIQSQMAGVSFDVNYWMNILRLSHEHKWGQAKTRAFHLEENPTEEKKLSETILALKGILQANNSEILESRFHPYNLDHKTKSKISDGKFLFWRWTNIEEWHRVKVRPPKDPANGITDTAKYQRTLFSHRILKRTGKNYYAFLGDVLDGLVQNSANVKSGILTGGSGSNPKDSFFGNARWSVTSTEVEVTSGKEGNPVTTVENFWAGWDLSKIELFKTIDGIDKSVQGLGLGLNLVNRDVFNDMLRLQLYEIRSTLILYDTGLAKLRAKLLAAGGSNGSKIQRFLGWDKFSGGDKELVEKVLIPLFGRKNFEEYCYWKGRSGKDQSENPTRTSYKAVDYDCLMPWMFEILELRRSYPTKLEEQAKWSTRIVNVITQNVELSKLVQFIGKENLFYQIKISGFRTRDANGDTADYKSSTIGSFNAKDRAGVFKDFVSDYQIMSSEMNANYLTEGY